ncbi:MAG TPA: NADH-quinone oxidoreductase subunit A [Planctomycetota bacterium]|nr:NADH-quinone oxidoreductase subunit A [Planctomycetota bacterium]
MEWGAVALYFGIVVALGGGIIAASRLLGPRRPAPEKLDAYECGVPVISSPRQRLSVHFYLVAILFILFDIETVFLIPWAVLFRKLGGPGLLEMGLFLGVVGFGLVYVWRRGALEWD